MKKTLIILGIVVFVVAAVLVAGPFFVLDEGEQAVVVRFGKIVRTHTEAGMKLRTPFVDIVNKYPKKILAWDGEKQRIPTKENQFIWVDATARWRIADLVKFYESVTSLDNAYGRLDDVIDSAVRTVISSNYLREAVRDSDEILKTKVVETFQTGDALGSSSLEELTISQTQYEKIEKGRRVLSNEMIGIVSSIVPEFGIEVIDIIPRQIKYSDELTDSVYQRMIKERNQIAQAFRSYGEGKKAEWLGKLENERRSVLSSAYAKSETLKGTADAEATRIYAEAYGKDPSFFEFWKAMESYKTTIPGLKKTLSTDMDYFKYLYSPRGR
ncbi:MAG: protease modulator HflC [Spirochaetia bacterium]|jgi:membrane protease subunit HflC|uniref:Modulator of FtsH protease HflC n=1 Tax=bioreactor metagenome TaxID=1076179 RepID=A0A644TIF6_9ZZZZ|nr:protease modulator HflC [Spirochaetia bacterium]MDD3820040.1 protease modulator HflC [Spirochaetales bacterium]NLX45582.1 protease modulator HflC [Treponema sp.]VBB40813.1 Protein HflC [uncultured Spirochaetota bacterium]MCE1208891.1 protease modulator HflC [Spirochaetia bacterium]